MQVVRVDAQHIAELTQFIQDVWDPSASIDGVARSRKEAACSNPSANGKDIPTFLFLVNGKAIGHVGTIPVRVWAEGYQHSTHWVKGLWVLPEHRNGPVGYYLLKDAVRALEHFIVLVVDPAPRRLMEAMGFVDLGTLPNHLKILNPPAVLRRFLPDWGNVRPLPKALSSLGGRLIGSPVGASLLGTVWRTGQWTWSMTCGRPDKRLIVEHGGEIDVKELDGLWNSVRELLPASPVRDGGYVAWRYDVRNKYRLVAVRRDNRLEAFAIVRKPKAQGDPRLNGVEVATISEILFHPDRINSGLTVVAAAEQVARDLGADVLLCSSSHRTLRSILHRRAFIQLAGNLHFLLRDPDKRLRASQRLDDWWLTRGDMNADEAF